MSESANEDFDRQGLRKNNEEEEEPIYVAAKDSEDGELLELPCNPDKTLSLTTLSHSFPGATGLKFKNPKTGASRAVMLDPTGSLFVCPAGGWEDRIFTAIFPPRVSSGVEASNVGVSGQVGYVGKAEAKRRKVNHSESDSDQDDILPRTDRQKAASVSKRERLSKPTDLLILGLPPQIEDETVRNYLETFGPVKLLNIKKNSEGQGKGFGFCIFENVEDQEKVLYQSHTIGGRLCEIKLPDRPYTSDTGGGPVSSARKEHSNSKKIFIGRITDKITSERLRDFFAEEVRKIDSATTIEDVYIPKPFRGFGFVTLSKSEVARKLCKLESVVIDGVSVAISEALRKQDEKPQEPEYSPSSSEYPPQYPFTYGGQLGGMYPSAGGSRSSYSPGPQPQPYFPRHKRPMRSADRGSNDYNSWGYGGYPGQAPPGSAGIDPAGWYPYQPSSHNIASGVDAINLNRQNDFTPRRYP
ncbi:unnamed protein product, partial [Mesorhabditis belari]|uniref:RRM domain-containing protein n=1 Tax=Mesorhabditis belari TaxID=2138241 RepID=A0AAF3EWF1_9BILA